jgi:hypothetical protein
MKLQKDIIDQFHKFVIVIIKEKILEFNDHHLSDKCKEDHFYVFMQ